MKTKIQLLLAFVTLFAISFTACKKNSADSIDFAVESAKHSDDQNQFSNETDALANDFNSIVDGYAAFNGRTSNTLSLPCDATVVVDSLSSPRKITITYNGATCNSYRTRTGVVVLTLPTGVRWKDAGAILTVTFQNLKITRTSDNKSITLNGVKTIKNVSGGLLRNLATANSIVHEINSTGLTITFDDNSQRSWQIAKRRTFTYNNGVVISTAGTATVDGISGVSEWGINRYGNVFVTAITTTQPMMVRQDCNWRLTSGQVTHYKLAATLSVSFGLDSAGNPTSCPGTAAYYFKLVYTGTNGVIRTAILPYY
jgi:hypothetical protein